MKHEEKIVKNATEKLSESMSTPNNKEAYERILKKATEHAVTPKDLLEMSDAQVEAIYAQAYRLYNTGKYNDAISLFRLLTMIDPTEAKFSLGLAACFHMLKDYKAASDLYVLCGVLDPESPIPAFHASDCYLQMKDKVSAIISLELAIKKAGQKPQYQILRDRAQLTIDSLKKDLNLNEQPKKDVSAS